VARVRAIHLSPVKSLGLASAERVTVTAGGIPGDRWFVLLDDKGELATLRKYGGLAKARSRFDPEQGTLELELADGRRVAATVNGGTPHTVEMFGRDVPGELLEGPWAEPLTELAGHPMRLLRVAEAGAGQDTYPMSLLSQESIDELASRNDLDPAPDPRRFRNTLLIEGAGPHGEDAWVGGRVRAGQAVLRIVERDVRCSLITRNPDTGERDLDTLRLIDAYRPRPDRDVCFGVYADVEQPGDVAVGDTVEPL
jgi:MOSC domain-containing protein